MLIEAPQPHFCDAPKIKTWTTDGVERARTADGEMVAERKVYREIPLRSLYRCEECGQRWIVLPHEWGPRWMPLRWYHRTAAGETLTALEQRRARERRRALAWFMISFVCAFVVVFMAVGWLT